MYIIIYIIAYILSYYWSRHLIKITRPYASWDWDDVILNAIFSLFIILVPIVGMFVWLSQKLPKVTPKLPKWLVLIPLILMSCSYKYYIVPGTLSFEKGKYDFKRSGKTVQLKDTVIQGYLIIRK